MTAPESETDLARRLLKEVLDGTNKWTPDMRLRLATVSQAYASLAIVDELRRLNEGRDQFHREVLDVLTQAKGVEPGQCPETAPPIFDGEPTGFCSLRAGHDGLHECPGGTVWKWEGPSEGPSGAGATAQVVEKEDE